MDDSVSACPKSIDLLSDSDEDSPMRVTMSTGMDEANSCIKIAVLLGQLSEKELVEEISGIGYGQTKLHCFPAIGVFCDASD